MRHKRFPIDHLAVAGRDISVRYCDLLVAVNEESEDPAEGPGKAADSGEWTGLDSAAAIASMAALPARAADAAALRNVARPSRAAGS